MRTWTKVLLLASILTFSVSGLSRSMTERPRAYYRVVERDGSWMFVGPDEKPFYSMGVNCVNMGTPLEIYKTDNPSYSALRHYDDRASWTKATRERLQTWQFNTIGAWSGPDAPESVRPAPEMWKAGMPYTYSLHLGNRVGTPWCDVFSPEIAKQLDKIASELVAPHRDDPDLLGYFPDNELGWLDDTLFLHFFRQPRTNATRRVLMRLLRQHYHGDFRLFQHDFDAGEARDFDSLERTDRVWLQPEGRGMEVIDKFTFLVAEQYYQLMHDSIRRYDQNHLLLGDRYHDFYPMAVARASPRYTDVVSTNHGADWTDGANARFYFETLYRLTKKPILVTELYFCAKENRSGNKNSGETNFPVVQTQHERARGSLTNLTDLASLPFVVGAHWFQYYDEPMHGREDGEDYNMGLVDIENRPYEELTAATASRDWTKFHSKAGRLQKPFGFAQGLRDEDLHVAISPPTPRAVNEGLKVWDKERGFIPTQTRLPFADIYCCWDPQAFYVAVYATDYVDENLYREGRIPESERMEFRLQLPRKRVSVRLGSQRPAVVRNATIVRESHGWNRETVILRLPASDFQKESFRSCDTIHIDATLTSHSRAERMKWGINVRLAVNHGSAGASHDGGH